MYRVMIVDDETVSQEYLRGLISWKEHGFELTEAAYNAAAAKKILAREKIALVLLDISMPGESGVSLSSFISRQYPDTLMLAISSHDDYDYVRQVLKNGAQDYILKHRMNAETLVSVLQNIRARLTGQEAHKEKNGTRQLLYRWIFMNGEYPLLSAEGICAANIARIPELEHIKRPMRDDIISSILTLIENNGKGISDITAVYREPDIFISFYLFANTVSQNKMLSDIFICSQKIGESLKQVYKMNYFSGDYPLITDYRHMPSHIVSAIENLGQPLPRETTTKPVTLSLSNKRRFIAALEEGNYVEAEYQIEQIYAGIQPGDYSLGLSVTNEFLDMLLSAAGENKHTELFSKNEELEWASRHRIEELPGRLKKIAAGILNHHGRTPVQSAYVKAALDIINDNYTKELRQDEVAAQLGLSPTYFSKLFKQETGTSFIETLNRYRVDVAKISLNNGESIKATARNCGFKQYNYFITVFKNYTGQTPAEYLKQK